MDHAMIIEKLKAIGGISEHALDLLANYLNGRKQRTNKSDGTHSKWQANKWGVPQGSVLGPLLFVLYCADIQDAITDARIVQFADDITLITSDKNPEQAVAKMNCAL